MNPDGRQQKRRALFARALLVTILIIYFAVRYAIQQYFRKDGMSAGAADLVVLEQAL